MTNTKRWLDELPLESHEREHLLVGKSARPADGAIDANWRALCLALGTTAAAGAVASSAAANAVSASTAAASSVSASTAVGSSLAASKVAGTGLLLVVTKSLAVGVAVGFAVMGVGTVAVRLSANHQQPAASAKPVQAPTARQPSEAAMPAPMAPQADRIASSPVSLLAGASSSVPAPRERASASTPTLNPAIAPTTATPAAAASPEDKAASLLQQARELAELKRLIDSGATTEALRRLDKNFSTDAVSVLSEERDALYVQALARAQRHQEARSFARRFLVRYPHSPYFEAMRQLLGKE